MLNFSVEAAAERGIDVVALEGATLAYQVQLFYRYQTVAMMHGAALANFIWMRPGATLIDIRPSELNPWPDHPWPHGHVANMPGVGVHLLSILVQPLKMRPDFEILDQVGSYQVWC
jgi:hypothetical protein